MYTTESDNIFGYHAMIKPHVFEIGDFSKQNCQTSALPTFEINGHGASVLCHVSDKYITCFNIYNLHH